MTDAAAPPATAPGGRIETRAAREQRGARQRFARPGGFHDRLVRVLGTVLPMAVGVLAAFMIVTPLAPRGEVGFLLDRNKVAVIDERLRVDDALYRGRDDEGRPFSLTAGEAVQRSSAEGIVRVADIVARVILPEGPARVVSSEGRYFIGDAVVDSPAPIRLTAADGYRMMARGVRLDLAARRMVGAGGVSGALPGITFSANRMEADLAARTVVLEGQARLRMIPGATRLPL